jgi:hypothetical protein
MTFGKNNSLILWLLYYKKCHVWANIFVVEISHIPAKPFTLFLTVIIWLCPSVYALWSRTVDRATWAPNVQLDSTVQYIVKWISEGVALVEAFRRTEQLSWLAAKMVPRKKEIEAYRIRVCLPGTYWRLSFSQRDGGIASLDTVETPYIAICYQVK